MEGLSRDDSIELTTDQRHVLLMLGHAAVTEGGRLLGRDMKLVLGMKSRKFHLLMGRLYSRGLVSVSYLFKEMGGTVTREPIYEATPKGLAAVGDDA